MRRFRFRSHALTILSTRPGQVPVFAFCDREIGVGTRMSRNLAGQSAVNVRILLKNDANYCANCAVFRNSAAKNQHSLYKAAEFLQWYRAGMAPVVGQRSQALMNDIAVALEFVQ